MNQSELLKISGVITVFAAKGKYHFNEAIALHGNPEMRREYESHASKAEAYTDAAEILLKTLKEM